MRGNELFICPRPIHRAVFEDFIKELFTSVEHMTEPKFDIFMDTAPTQLPVVFRV